MADLPLHKEDHERDAELSRAIHGDSSKSVGGIGAMFNKKTNNNANDTVVDNYFNHFGDQAGTETQDGQEARQKVYANVTNAYYNISTDLYEYGWGESFHFSRFAYGESFHKSIARHEHYLASKMGLKSGMKVLDVGCGVGGPGREIVKFSDAHVTGLNNNDYQIDRARQYAVLQNLEDKMDFVKGDFMQMGGFKPNTFDAVYAIEATVHAQTLLGVYSKIFEVLKPGGVFGLYEWLMTDKYDPENADHLKIRRDIEVGNGISSMQPISVCLKALADAGFEIEINEDLAAQGDAIPWYWPIAGEMKYMSSYFDLFTVLRMTKTCRSIMHNVFSFFETVGLFPKGVKKAADGLATGADGLVAGAKEEIFTPMYFVIARKPASPAEV